MKKHTILNELARPDTLKGFICDEDQKNKFEEYIEKQDIPHIGLFSKLPGCGKSTLSKILAKNIDCDFLYLNAMDNRGMDSIKEKVGSFASAGSFKPLKIVILDEATHILEASQVLLLNMMETFSLNTRFILTGNFPERLIEPLRSRLQEFELLPPSKQVVGKRLMEILDQQEIKYSKEDLVTIINSTYPDLRSMYNLCDQFTLKGEIKLGKITNSQDNWKELVLDILKSPDRSSLKNLRQILVDANKNDFEDVYRFLYENIEEYDKKGDTAEIIILIEEGLYKTQSRLNKEINIVSTLAKLLKVIS